VQGVSLVSTAIGRALVAVAAIALVAPHAAGAEPAASGDIPDTQAFVRYASPDGYSILFPEGWSRTVKRSEATFVSHFNGERVLVRPHAPPAVLVHGIASRMSGVTTSERMLGTTRVTHVRFSAASDADPVTGKTIPLDGEAFVFRNGSRDAIVYVWGPHGADNADQWNAIARSFRWR
jgi:hypothetical protein